jgi:hypothetical protein
MYVLICGYQAYKWFFYSLGLEDSLMALSDKKHTPSPPSDLQLKWGLQGIKDGIKDEGVGMQELIDAEYKKIRIQSGKRPSNIQPGKPSDIGSLLNEPTESQTQAWVKTITIPKVDIHAPHYVSHMVRSGERVWYLADSYGYKDRKQFTEDIRRLNPGIDFTRLKPGQIINVPSKVKNPKLDTPYALKTKPVKTTQSPSTIGSLQNLWQQGFAKSRPHQIVPPDKVFIDPVKKAAQMLKTTYKPAGITFASTTDTLKRMEKKFEEQRKTQNLLNNFSHDLNKGIQSKPFQTRLVVQDTHAGSLQDMWERGINKSRPMDPYSGKPRRSVLEVNAHTPLDPNYHWEFPPEVITHSRPIPNPLREMSQGLMNQNKARSMFR